MNNGILFVYYYLVLYGKTDWSNSNQSMKYIFRFFVLQQHKTWQIRTSTIIVEVEYECLTDWDDMVNNLNRIGYLCSLQICERLFAPYDYCIKNLTSSRFHININKSGKLCMHSLSHELQPSTSGVDIYFFVLTADEMRRAVTVLQQTVVSHVAFHPLQQGFLQFWYIVLIHYTFLQRCWVSGM